MLGAQSLSTALPSKQPRPAPAKGRHKRDECLRMRAWHLQVSSLFLAVLAKELVEAPFWVTNYDLT